MSVFVKIGEIDIYGYCGRDHHPESDDAGKTGRLLSYDEDGDGIGVLTVELRQGGVVRIVELVEHEVDEVRSHFDEDEMR